MPKVSIIVPVYNDQRFVKESIESAVTQEEDIEVIAVNDGSTDKSSKILHELEEKYSGILRVYDRKNGGAGTARNFGLDKSSGEYIKFLDADDTLPKGIITKMYDAAKYNDASLVKGNYKKIIGPISFIDPGNFEGYSSGIVDVRDNKDVIVTEYPSIGNKLFSRKLIGDLRFPESTKWEDLAIVPTLIASSKEMVVMDDVVYNYRINLNTTIKDFIVSTSQLLDIIKCLKLVETTMADRNLLEEYKEQVEGIYILHLLFRVQNVMNWKNISRSKKKMIIGSLLAILDSKYPNWESNRFVNQYKEAKLLFKRDINRLNSFIDNYYRYDTTSDVAQCSIEYLLRR